MDDDDDDDDDDDGDDDDGYDDDDDDQEEDEYDDDDEQEKEEEEEDENKPSGTHKSLLRTSMNAVWLQAIGKPFRPQIFLNNHYYVWSHNICARAW